jgi:hypothetical protein
MNTMKSLLAASLISALLVGGVATADVTAAQRTVDDLLPGVELRVREVAPGVLRVLHDGIRDLRKQSYDEGLFSDHGLIGGSDGSVWVVEPDRLWRIGDKGSYRWPEGLQGLRRGQVGIAPDGVLWVERRDWPGGMPASVYSCHGATWNEHEFPADADVTSVEFSPDGSVWAAWTGPDGDAAVGRLVEGRWDVLAGEPPQIFGFADNEPWFQLEQRGSLLTDPEGGLWIDSPSSWEYRFGGAPLYHYVDGEWREQEAPPGPPAESWATLGRNGELWLARSSDAPKDYAPDPLAYFDGSAWQTFDRPLGALPKRYTVGPLAVAPDGDMWASVWMNKRDVGLARFDGETWTRYLPDSTIYSLALTPDGDVWLQAGSWDWEEPARTYVIPAEGIAAGS